MRHWTVFGIILLSLGLFGQTGVGISGLIATDAVWSGNVLVSGDLTIQRGATLTIRPGTRVLIYPGQDQEKGGEQPDRIEIVVMGRLLAEGEPGDRQIVFTSASPVQQMHDWYGIVFKTRGEASVLQHVTIEYAYNGITCYGSSPRIENSTFQYNYYTGINCLVRSQPLIRSSMIIANGFAGINCELAAAPVVENCIISQNANGIVIYDRSNPDLGRETPAEGQSSGGNHLFNNFDYNIYNRSQYPVYTQNNFWNTNDIGKIRQQLFDGKLNRQYGEVLITPYLKASRIDDREYQNTSLETPTPAPAAITVTTPQNNDNGRRGSSASRTPVTRNAVSNIVPERTVSPSTQPQRTERRPAEPLATQSIPATASRGEETISDSPADAADSQALSERNTPNTPIETETSPTVSPSSPPALVSINQPVIELFLDGGRREYIRRTNPAYPQGYRRAGIEGTVLIEVIVSRDGRVQSARVLRSDGDAFADAARAALSEYRYKSGTYKGQPVSYKIVERFEFKLTDN